MKSIELRRHAEKDPNGLLTKAGIEAAKSLAKKLPLFSHVISSDSERALLTAKLISSIDPRIDSRASMYMASSEKSNVINEIAIEKDLTFLEAIYEYADPEIIENTELRAHEFNELIDQMFDALDKDGYGLIISHDLSISAAMAKCGIPIETIAPLEGYIIYENGDIIFITTE
jgi:broad specificity phosphatase PhoE